MLSKEELEQKYQQTFGEEIVFDEVKQRGPFLIASKKEEKNRFLMGAGGVENEKNSMTYYVVNTADGSEAKMVISSQEEVEGNIKKNNIEIFSGKNNTTNLKAFNVYIDTANKQKVCKFLTGGYPEAEYSAYSPKTEKLFSAWYHSSKDYPTQDRKFQEYHKEEISEIKNALKTARQFFASFIGDKKDLRLAKEQSSIIQRVTKFCKRLTSHEKEPEFKTFYKDFRDNNRF
jgi:hypothetical protein